MVANLNYFLKYIEDITAAPTFDIFRDLSRNLIETIPDQVLQKCPKLEVVELKRNPIKSFHVNAFADLPMLKKL